MKRSSTIIIGLCLALSLSACGKAADSASAVSGEEDAPEGISHEETSPVETSPAETSPGETTPMFTLGEFQSPQITVEDTEISEGTESFEGAAQIKLTGTGAESDSDKVIISGSTVTITSEGEYIVSGMLDDGTVIIDADKSEKVELILNGAGIASSTSAAIYVRQADKLKITLAKDSVNMLSNRGSFEAEDDESNIDAVVFSRDDITLDGEGTLTVLSVAGHGIVTKDDLKIKGGNYIISAAGHGLSANESIEAEAGSLEITSAKDGLNCGNGDEQPGVITIDGGEFKITSTGDGFSTNGTLTVNAGTFNIVSGGGSAKSSSFSSASSKAMKASGGITIAGGEFTLDSIDDAIHSNSSVTISEGSFVITSGDDGVHSDETLTVCGGSINIKECVEGLEGMTVNISDGKIRIDSSDDGINAAGGKDQSGIHGDDFGHFGGPGGFGGGFGGFSNDSMWPNPPKTPPTGNHPIGKPSSDGAPDEEPPEGEPPADVPPENEPPEDVPPEGEPPTSPEDGTDSSDCSINISGGVIYINAAGDGLDSNGAINISGGKIYISGPTSSFNSAIDYETSGSVTGGTVIAAGSQGMAQNFSYAEQGSIFLNTGRQKAGTEVRVLNENKDLIAKYTPEKDYETLVISCPKLTVGSTYIIMAGEFSQSVTLDTELYGVSSEGFGGGGTKPDFGFGIG